MFALTVISGAAVGLLLGLAGAGGALLAVPLLVYGLSVEPTQAVLVSLVAVGVTSLFGAANRAYLRQIDYRAAGIFGIGGVLGAPFGTWLGGQLPHALMLGLFAVLTLIVAFQMWRKADANPKDAGTQLKNPVSHYANAILIGVGSLTGVLSGIFGVGGGFLIVPALIAARGMNFRRAVGTSMFAVTIISGAAAGSALAEGRLIPADLTALFVCGALTGLVAGLQLGQRIAAPRLQRFFAVGMVAVAAFTLFKSVPI